MSGPLKSLGRAAIALPFLVQGASARVSHLRLDSLGPDRDADAFKVLAVFALLYGFFWGAAVFNGGRRIRMLAILSLVLFAPGVGLHLWLRLTDPTDPLASQALAASVWLMGAGFATALLALVPSVIGKARS